MQGRNHQRPQLWDVVGKPLRFPYFTTLAFFTTRIFFATILDTGPI